MNITVTGRHLDVSDGLRDYAERKIMKLERYFNQLMDAHVILSVEKLDHISEVVINGDGVQFHGKERAADLHSAVDLLFEKMEAQIRRHKEKHQMHKGPEKGGSTSFESAGEQGTQVILRQVSNKPVDNVEAYLQMKAGGLDFMLYRKGEGKMDADAEFADRNYAAIFREGDQVRLVELHPEKKHGDHFVVYEVRALDDSPVKPNVKFTKTDSFDLGRFTLHEAILEIDRGNRPFLPFYNTESQAINIIRLNGSKYEVMVPAS